MTNTKPDIKTKNEKPLLPESKVSYVIELIESGSIEKIKEINKLIEQYKFRPETIEEILKLTPIDKLLNINIEVLNPKIVVRVIAGCLLIIKKTDDKKLIYKCRRILEIAYDNLYKINFGTDEFRELAEIDDKKIYEYVASVSNNFNIQAKILLPDNRVSEISHILESGQDEKVKQLNDFIEKYKFSYERLTDILKVTSLENLKKINVDLLNPKIIVRVIACCADVLKKSHDNDLKEKFKNILAYAAEKLYDLNLGKEEYLELAQIEDKNILAFANMSNHFEVRSMVSKTASRAGITL